MGKHLVLVGGGHAHLTTIANIPKFTGLGHRVTVIGPSPYHYYSGMGPGMLGGLYRPEDIRFATRRAVEKLGGVFLQDRAVEVDPVAKTVRLESGTNVVYDAVSFNVGSHVSRKKLVGECGDVFTVKPIEKLSVARKRMLELMSSGKTTIGVIGGGPASVEIAGNLWGLARRHGKFAPEIRLFAGKKFLSLFPDSLVSKALNSLTKRNIQIIENGYAKKVESGRIILESGESHCADIVFLATGVKPSPIFKSSGLPVGQDGGLLVNKYLQSVEHPEIFGGGDCVCFKDRPLDKVGVYAVRQNAVLLSNLAGFMAGRPLRTFDPGGDYLLVFNMGDGTGILRKKSFVYAGRAAFMLKNYIDRKFMKKFKAIE